MDTLQQGIAAYKAGKRDEARRLLIQAMKENPNSEQAWVYNQRQNQCQT